MNSARHRGYLTAIVVIGTLSIDEAAPPLLEAAEDLLLARDRAEAEAVRAVAAAQLRALVDDDVVSRRDGHRIWRSLQVCGPPIAWPLSWDDAPVPAAVSGG